MRGSGSARHGADHRLVGAAFVIAAVACFAGLDTGTKLVSAVPVAMVMWLRYAVQAGMTAATQLPWRGRALMKTRHPWLQVLRGTLILLTSVFAYLSLRTMPLGEFTAIVMLTPIVMTLISAFAFREHVSPLRWLLIGVIFWGGLLVVGPGVGTLSPSMLLPLATLALNTAFHLVTSRLAAIDDAATMQFWTGCTGTALATLALPFFWVPIDSWSVWAILALICVLSTVGHWMLIVGYSKAGVATLTPLLFAQIGFGTLLGWLVFDHVPDAQALMGIALIGTGGAACTWLTSRERAPRARVVESRSFDPLA